MSNPSSSSIAFGSISLGFVNASEPGRTDPPPAQNMSFSSRTQSEAQHPSSTGTEGSYNSPPTTLTPPSGDIVTPTSFTGSFQTAQLETKPPSAGEESVTSSHPQVRDTIPFSSSCSSYLLLRFPFQR
ncbi:hypothetical protein P9112_007879 [Eukaryota sp. TZLM1-RC]